MSLKIIKTINSSINAMIKVYTNFEKKASTVTHNRGQLTIGVGLAWAAVTAAVSLTAGYFVNLGAVTSKVSENSATVNQSISEDRSRISSLETTTTDIDKRLDRIENKLDEVLNKK
jgi:hypothetical protein